MDEGVKTTLAIRPIAQLFPGEAKPGEGRAQVRVAGRSQPPFAAAEIIERDDTKTTRRLLSVAGLRAAPDPRLAELVARLESPRPPIAGLIFDRPRIMGIVNVTPDSFADGGRFFDPVAAVEHALQL